MTSTTGNVDSDTNNDIINYDIVNSIISLSNNNEFTNTLISGFYNDTETLLTDMEKALSRNNHELFLEYAHALKGSAGSVGAQKLHDYCKILLIPETDCSDYIPILQKLLSAFEYTKDALDNYIDSKRTNTR